MKRAAFIAGLLVLIAVGVFTADLLSAPKKGSMETFSQLHDSGFGSAYVRGRYNDFLNGWDVAFFHRDVHRQWFVYYLAHESRRWGHAKLYIHGNLVIVNNGEQTVAEYNTESGVFTHEIQGVTYTRQDGLEGALEATRRTSTVKLPE